jgi:hypothetical protein
MWLKPLPQRETCPGWLATALGFFRGIYAPRRLQKAVMAKLLTVSRGGQAPGRSLHRELVRVLLCIVIGSAD